MNNTLRFGIISLIALTVFSMTACDDGADHGGGGPEEPGVISVKVEPNGYIVYRGGTQTFIAGVSGTADKAVTWSIEGDGLHADTGIDQSGTLSVSPDEEQTALIVKAVLVADATKYGTAVVTVPAPTVTGVEISLAGGILINPWNSRNKAIDVDSGREEQFLAKVVGENFPSQEVEWSIDGTISNGTSISEGLLTVSPDQPQNSTFTVRAASKVEETILDRITVTVKPPTINYFLVVPSSTTISSINPVDFAITVLGTGNIQGLHEIERTIERSDGRPIMEPGTEITYDNRDGTFDTWLSPGTRFDGNTLYMTSDEITGEIIIDIEGVENVITYEFDLVVTITVTSDTLPFSPSMETSREVRLTVEDSFTPSGQLQH